jgi:hypothetical protein
MSSYQLSVGDNAYELRVPEEYVLSGAVINVSGSQQTASDAREAS